MGMGLRLGVHVLTLVTQTGTIHGASRDVYKGERSPLIDDMPLSLRDVSYPRPAEAVVIHLAWYQHVRHLSRPVPWEGLLERDQEKSLSLIHI